MNGVGFVFITGAGIAAAAALFFAMAKDKKQDKKQADNSMSMLSGEVLDIFEDHETGFSVIAVRDDKGVTQYGFSRLSARELEALYSGRGCVQVPVISKKAAQ